MECKRFQPDDVARMVMTPMVAAIAISTSSASPVVIPLCADLTNDIVADVVAKALACTGVGHKRLHQDAKVPPEALFAELKA